ncbi:hypothetical protein CC86DRAFT_18012, partial [Ophiobolus disseminans]
HHSSLRTCYPLPKVLYLDAIRDIIDLAHNLEHACLQSGPGASEGLTVDDVQLLHSLSIVRGKLQIESQFYSCIEDPTKLYILGIWQDLNKHHSYRGSPARNEVLGPQDEMLDLQWSISKALRAETRFYWVLPF